MRWRTFFREQSVCTIFLIAANVIVFIILSILGQTENAQFMLDHGAMYVPYVVERNEYYRLFTSMFLHFGFEHLMNNMIMLGVIGWSLEREIGSIRFMIIYLGSGLCGNIVSAVVSIYQQDFAVSAGASGAIFGIMGAMLYVAIRNRGRVGDMSGVGLLVMVVLSLYYGFIGAGIDNLAHIGGLISGFLLGVLLYWKRSGRRRRRRT